MDLLSGLNGSCEVDAATGAVAVGGLVRVWLEKKDDVSRRKRSERRGLTLRSPSPSPRRRAGDLRGPGTETGIERVNSSSFLSNR